MLLIQAHADGVGTAVGDERIGSGDSVKNRRSVEGNLARGKAEAGSHLRIDIEVGGRDADGVIDSVFDFDNSGNLADGVAHARTELREEIGVARKELDLDRLGRIRQVADHVLQNLSEFDIELRLGGLDLLTDIFHYIVDATAAFGLELHREIAGVGFSHCGQPHLQAGAA